MNSTIVGVEEADRIVIIGCNPRYEAPLVNARIRKAWLHAETEVDVIGSEVNLSYTYNYHGNDPQSEYLLHIRSKTYFLRLQFWHRLLTVPTILLKS